MIKDSNQLKNFAKQTIDVKSGITKIFKIKTRLFRSFISIANNNLFNFSNDQIKKRKNKIDQSIINIENDDSIKKKRIKIFKSKFSNLFKLLIFTFEKFNQQQKFFKTNINKFNFNINNVQR